MKFGVVTFPGSNGDYDAYQAAMEALGEEAVFLWHKDHDLQGSDVVILPGGFSHGDYLRAGAIARFSPIMREVVQHALRRPRPATPAAPPTAAPPRAGWPARAAPPHPRAGR